MSLYGVIGYIFDPHMIANHPIYGVIGIIYGVIGIMWPSQRVTW